jgi:sister chromatid cohesion protein PDS5
VLIHAASVLQFCIDESEGVSDDVLETLLLPLLPHNKADHPTAYKLAGTVLRRVTGLMQAPITAALNQILIGTSRDSIGGNSSSEVADHIYALLYELHKISPALLTGVLPNICVQLQVEEEDIRLKAVRVLGSLFASPHADYCTDFARNFKEFLGRLSDLSADIRLTVVESCAAIVQAKPAMRAVIEGMVMDMGMVVPCLLPV